MQLAGKVVLVTGAAGFIGSHLAEELVEKGARVRALVRYNSRGSRGWLDSLEKRVRDSLEVVAGDVRDPYGVRGAVGGCEVVFHLAALIGIPYSYSSPETYVDTNIKGTLNVLQAVRELGVSRLLQTSTSEVYGTARYVPIDEEHPLQGQSPYSATKIAADQLALSFFRSFGTPVTVVRPFNTYGPRQSARAVIPALIIQLLGHGGPIKLGALHPTRDFNYVKDTVRGFIAAAEGDRVEGEVINIGSGFEVSVKETAEVIAQAIGRPLEIEIDAARIRPGKSEVERLLASNVKASRLIGWRPLYGGIDGFKRGIQETVEWFSSAENRSGYREDLYNV